MQQGIHDTGLETPSAGTRRQLGDSTPVCQQRLSPFASVADHPIDTSSSPPPAPGTAAATANQQPQTLAGPTAAQAATPEPIGAAALSSSQHMSLIAAAFASHARPQHAEPSAAAAMLSPAAAAAGQLLSKGLMTPEDTATAAAAVAAAINAASNHSPMASPLPQQHMQEEQEDQQQQDQQPDYQQQQQRKQAGSVSLQQALLSVMLREVLPDEVNNLKDTLEVLTHFDLQQVNRSRRGPQGNSSSYRGVTRHRRTQRWEAHIWDSKKQVYLGGFDNEVAAAKAHDVMAIKTRGVRTLINFKISVYQDLLPHLENEDNTRDDVIAGLRGTSKLIQRRATPGRTPAIKRTPPHSPRLTAMAAAAAAAASGSSPRTPVSRVPYDGDSGSDYEEEEAAALLRRAERASRGARKGRGALAAAAAAAAAAMAAAADDDGERQTDGLKGLLVPAGRAGKGRGGKQRVLAPGSSSSSIRSQPPYSRAPAGYPRPHSSPTLPGLGSPFGAGAPAFGRNMPPPGLYDLDPGFYGSPGLRPRTSPQGLRPPGLLPGSFGQGLADLSHPSYLTVEPLDVMSEGLSLPGSHQGFRSGFKAEQGDQAGQRLSTHLSTLSARQLIYAATARLDDKGLPRPPGHLQQQQEQFAVPGALASPQSTTTAPFRPHHLASPPAFSSHSLAGATRSFSFELEQQLAEIPPLHPEATGRYGQQPTSQQQQQQLQLQGRPPHGSVSAAAAAARDAIAAAVSRGGFEGGPSFDVLVAAAAKKFLPNPVTHSFEPPDSPVAQPQGLAMPDRPFRHPESRPPPGQAGAASITPFSTYSRQQGIGSSNIHMAAAAAAGESAGAGMMAPGLRHPDDMVMSSQDDAALLIPNMHADLQTTGTLVEMAAQPSGSTMGLRQMSLDAHTFQGLELPVTVNSQAQQQLQGVSADIAAEATAAMASNRAAGRSQTEAAGGAGVGGRQQQEQQAVALGIMSGSKRGFDFTGMQAAAAPNAAFPAARTNSLGLKGITLPGIPVDDEEVEALEANHAAAAAAMAAATAAAAAMGRDEEDAEEQAALEAAASAAANAASEFQMAAAVARRYTWPGGPQGAAELYSSADPAAAAAAAEAAARDTGLYSPRLALRGQQHLPAAATAASFLAAANAERLRQQQQQQQQFLQEQQQQYYRARLRPPTMNLDVLVGAGGLGSGMGCHSRAELRAPGLSMQHITSPTQVAAMQEATELAEMAAATAAVMAADKSASTAAAAAAAAAAAGLGASAAEQYYREARMTHQQQQQQQTPHYALQHQTVMRSVSPMVPQQSPPPSLPQSRGTTAALSTSPTSSSSLKATAAATAAAAEAAMAAAAAVTESALTSAVFAPDDSSLAFNNQQRGYPMMTPSQHAVVARQYSSNATSSFSMPSEGTATAAAALAGLANAGGQFFGQQLQYSPTTSHQEQQQRQQQQQQQQELHGPLFAPGLAGDPEAAAGAAGWPSAIQTPLGSNMDPGMGSLACAVPPAGPGLQQAAAGDQVAANRQDTAVEGHPSLLQLSGGGGGGGVMLSPTGCGPPTAGGGCSSSKPPLPPNALAATAAAAAGAGGLTAGPGNAGSPPHCEGAAAAAGGGGGVSDRVLSPAGSGTSRLPAAACLVP